MLNHKSKSKISIVIPCLNESDYISGILNDLNKQTLLLYEVIVVDGGSADKTIEVVKTFQSKLSALKLIQTHKGVGHQRSLGCNQANGDIIILIDADCRIEPDFLKVVISKFEKSNLDIACPLYLPYKSSRFMNFVYWQFNILFFVLQKLIPSGAGECIIVKKEMIKKYGNFDEKLIYDDIEFVRRIGSKSKFGIITEKIFVSDRRFKKEGVIKLLFKYAILSLFFTFGLFKQANRIKYF